MRGRWTGTQLRERLGVKVKSKYGNKATTVRGIRFDSQAEGRRYEELMLLVAAGVALYVLRQVPFDLPGGIKYRADFMIAWADGRITYEDVKGVETQVFKIKKKQVEDLYPVVIEIVKMRGKR